MEGKIGGYGGLFNVFFFFIVLGSWRWRVWGWELAPYSTPFLFDWDGFWIPWDWFLVLDDSFGGGEGQSKKARAGGC